MFTRNTAGPSKPWPSLRHSTITAQQITLFRSRPLSADGSGEASTIFNAQPGFVGCDSRKEAARPIACFLASRFEIFIYPASLDYLNGLFWPVLPIVLDGGGCSDLGSCRPRSRHCHITLSSVKCAVSVFRLCPSGQAKAGDGTGRFPLTRRLIRIQAPQSWRERGRNRTGS